MHTHSLADWTHEHVFDAGNYAAERGTRAVMWITAVMMVVEIVAGWWFNSMALLADGWHMSSHAVAIGLSAFAYAAARRYARDPRFAFGTWKIEILGGFASAIFLMGIAALMVIGSVERIFSPQAILYREAMIVAATSVLAIVALAGGWFYGWSWLDPVMGIVGAVLVAIWAKKLIAETGKVLLDREMDHPIVGEIREALETGPDAGETRVTDLHVWRVGKGSYACALSVVTHDKTLTPDAVREGLARHEEIVHTTVEIHQCR